jgi:hypothetical protein
LKKYTIEIEVYPQEFIIVANNETEAIMDAQQRFYDKNNAGNIYQTQIMDIEEI